jgi:hypothetical protein
MTQRRDDDSTASRAAPERESLLAEHVQRVRVGHGANCSSIGSVVDTLFATATIGAAVFAAVVAALSKEPVRQAPGPEPGERPLGGDGAP